MTIPKLDLSGWGPVTVLLVAITVIAALAGAVICIVHPETLTFEALLNDLEKFAIALGLLGIGRGIHNQGKEVAVAAAAGSTASSGATAADATVDTSLEVGGQKIPPDEGDVGNANVATDEGAA